MMSSRLLRRAGIVLLGLILLLIWTATLQAVGAHRWFIGYSYRGLPIFTDGRLLVLIVSTPLLVLLAIRHWRR